MTAPARQQVKLTAIGEHTRLDKPYRHLRTSIHWSKVVYRIQNLPNYTLELSNDFPELPALVRHFSEYYPHVAFHVLQPGQTTRVFRAGKEQATEA